MNNSPIGFDEQGNPYRKAGQPAPLELVEVPRRAPMTRWMKRRIVGVGMFVLSLAGSLVAAWFGDRGATFHFLMWTYVVASLLASAVVGIVFFIRSFND